MKGTSVYSQGVSVKGSGIYTFLSALKDLTLKDFLVSVFCGIISQGTMLNIMKPFGPSFYAAYSGNATVKVLMTGFIFAWNIIRGDLFAALRQTAVIFLYEWIRRVFLRNGERIGYLKNALITSAATAITGIFIFIINNQVLESLLAVSIEVVLSCILTMVFSTTIHGQESFPDGFAGHKNTGYFGLLVLGSAFLLGISGLGAAWFHIDRIIAGLGLLLLARHFGPGFGACAGCAAGLALSAGSPGSFISLAGMYGISGMTAGLLHGSKAAAGSVFFLVQFLFALLSPDLPVSFPDLLIPAVLFIIVPDLRTGRVVWIRNRIEKERCEPDNSERIRRLASERINDMSKALYKLGHTLERRIGDSELNGEDFYNSIIDHLTQKVCISCGKSNVCWEMKLFYTYNVMLGLIDSMQSGETESVGNAERELTLFCVKSGLVTDVLSRVIEIKRVDMVWQEILNESRSVIPEQIYCISETLAKLSGEVLNDVEFFLEEERKIETMLKRNDLPVVKAEVRRECNGRFHAFIGFDGCNGNKPCRKLIENTVSGVLGVGMVIEDEDCKNRGRENCTVFLREKETLGVITGISKAKKSKAGVSGDCFSFLKTDEGKYIVALSDGMGSGREANRLSETAIGLLEQLLGCGISVRMSLNLVNMLISVKNTEKYATMDIASIDLYTGETEFFKMGAMPSLVMSGNNIDYIQVNNLPAGLHRDGFIQCERRKLSDGEFLIMMTDGVYEKLNEGMDGKILDKVTGSKSTLNPQEMADNLLKEACGNTWDIDDDMTVLVAKIWKKAG
ncbi:MAG: SpoIIE family protein phosphatase [Clostridiaceae bacterium]|nr:SpoIIE family protein phosphatase [Clostridiaceae bacterium]